MPFETHSLPHSLAATLAALAFCVAYPIRSILPYYFMLQAVRACYQLFAPMNKITELVGLAAVLASGGRRRSIVPKNSETFLARSGENE